MQMTETAEQSGSKFKYDVAISFLAADESIAQQIADALMETTTVFVYSEQQKELAGKDGLNEFTCVFAEQARVCVVLYRAGWGETKWTRVEETAIKDRAFDSGWEFLTVIGMSRTGPVWLPKTKLWLGYERFGLEGAVAVIDARVREQGGVPRVESATERASRIQRHKQAAWDRHNFLQSKEGVAAAIGQFRSLQEYIQREAPKLQAVFSEKVIFTEREGDDYFALGTRGVAFTAEWQPRFSNMLSDSALEIVFYGEFVRVDIPTAMSRNALGKLRCEFILNTDGTPGWVMNTEKQKVLSTVQLAEVILNRFVDVAAAPKRGR